MLELNVLTANIHMGFSFTRRRFVLPELRQAIREVSADLVFLQEVLGEHSGHSLRHADWPQVPHYEFLADTLWPQFAYGRNAVYPAGHHGNALLSKFPIISHRNRDVSISGHESRGLLHCVLQIPGSEQQLHTLCVHLGLRESHRNQQLHLLCRMVEKKIPVDAPLIVAGDFNDWRQTGHQMLLNCGLHEVFAHANGRLPRTYPARWPLLPLDRIYLRNLRARDLDVFSSRPWSHLSDHAVLRARVGIETAGAAS